MSAKFVDGEYVYGLTAAKLRGFPVEEIVAPLQGSWHPTPVESLLGDAPASVTDGRVPPLVLTAKDEGWQERVRQAVLRRAIVQGPMSQDLEVARLIATTSAEIHEAEARRARETIERLS